VIRPFSERELDAIEQFRPLLLHQQTFELRAKFGTGRRESRLAGGFAAAALR
jgi:hypothetical protein